MGVLLIKSDALPEGWHPSDRGAFMRGLQVLNSCEEENYNTRMIELAVLESKSGRLIKNSLIKMYFHNPEPHKCK